ncbi:MAG: MFS transporter [Elusimicrobia bacterium]|nr:MFS transporter [Elusimicrobiota bacterium]
MLSTSSKFPAARGVLALLLGVNLLNYLDRQILYSLLPLIQRDLTLSDAQAGSLASAFMVVYMLAAPPIGYWADRQSRPLWLALGVLLWSLATAAGAWAKTFSSLFAARAAVGIGESCYGAISPSFVAEHFPSEKRGRVLALFSMAIPVGSALGYICGGILGQSFGWRNALLWVAVPGLILAALSARLRDPRPDHAPRRSLHYATAVRSYADLFKVKSFALVTLAGAAMTFALGGFAVWMPTFFHRQWGLQLGRAGALFGGVTVVSGILGSLAGGWLSDWGLSYTKKSHFLVSGAGLLAGLPLVLCAVLCENFHLSLATLLLAEFFLFLNMGPLNAIIVEVSDPASRSMAFAANILVIHALGDAVSPTVIGLMSDLWGLNLALILASLTLGLGGAFCLWGARYYENDAKQRHG